MGLFFILLIVGLIFYCVYKVHSKIVFNLYEPYCFKCNIVFDIGKLYYAYCPKCKTKIIWRKKNKNQLLKDLIKYREKRRRK